MDRTFRASPQPYQYWERFYTQPPHSGSPLPDFNQAQAVYGDFQQSPDDFLTFDDLDDYELYPSSGPTSSRNSFSAHDIHWRQSAGMHDVTSSPRRSSEGKETSAQSRRKEQNRAAQRAFRERKERRIKELEGRIANLEEQSQSIGGENKRLKEEIQQLKSSNHMLRATSDHDDLDHYVEYSSWRAKQQKGR